MFQQVLYFKDFFCSLWPLIVQHLSAIFHNHDQIKTLNENYYLNSFCALISTGQKSRAYCSFSLIIYLLYQNKRFVVFYEFEQICSNVQFIPSPIEVREFLLRLLKSYRSIDHIGNRSPAHPCHIRNILKSDHLITSCFTIFYRFLL